MQLAASAICLILLQHLILDSQQYQPKNLSHDLTRHIRSLSFPENSNMGLFFAIAIPIDIPDKSISVSWYFEANYGIPAINDSAVPLSLFQHQGSEASCCSRKRSLDRRMLYDILQSRLESNGYPGRACLLRTICESARFPFGLSGLVGDITRIIFTFDESFAHVKMITETNTPRALQSTMQQRRKILNGSIAARFDIFRPSSSQREEYLDVEFEEAEKITDCSKFSEKCDMSLLESISRSFE